MVGDASKNSCIVYEVALQRLKVSTQPIYVWFQHCMYEIVVPAFHPINTATFLQVPPHSPTAPQNVQSGIKRDLQYIPHATPFSVLNSRTA